MTEPIFTKAHWKLPDPRFEHDGCGGCLSLGQYGEFDLYFCPQNGMPTVIARYSSEGPDYYTIYPIPHWRTDMSPYQLALFAAGQRAIGLGLTTEEILLR